MKLKLNKKYVLIGILFLLLIFILFVSLKSPSNNKNWNDDQKILSFVEINENEIKIFNIRNISYKSTEDFNVSYYNRTFNLTQLKTLDYLVEELKGFPGFAHTLLTFGFEDGSYVSISVEIRKEKGEKYHPITGMLNKFELMYVIADEKDVINLRTNYRNDTVYLYPIKISKESLDDLFLLMLKETNNLKYEPKFYHTLFSTCTTNLAEVASDSTNESFFKYHYKILLPGFSDELLLSRGLIKTNLTEIEDVRSYFNINEKARELQYSTNFSYGIRN